MNYQYNRFIKSQFDQAFDKLVAREILNFQGHLMASNEENGLYASSLEVNGWRFLKMTIIGTLNIDLMEGCQVKFQGKTNAIIAESDQRRIKTEYSSSLEMGITQFDVLMEEEMLDLIRSEAPFSIVVLVPSEAYKSFFVSQPVTLPFEFVIQDVESFRNMF